MYQLCYQDFDLENWQCVIDQLKCDNTLYEFVYSIWHNPMTLGMPAIIEIYDDVEYF